MVKTTKRSRKFTKTGGVQKRIKNGGTITKKGKLRQLNRKKSKAEEEELEAQNEARAAAKLDKQITELSGQEKKRKDNDFLGDSNLKDLDMDAFLNAAADSDDKNDSDDDASMQEDLEQDDNSDDDSSEASSKGENDDEEDLDAAEERMKHQMQKLQEDDPEFHKFLKENDTSLLEFGADKNEEVDDESAHEEDEVMNEQENNDSNNSKILDRKALNHIEQTAFDAFGMKGLKRCVLAYKIACHLSDPDQEENNTFLLYQIDSSSVFDRLMVVSLTRFHEAFYYHLIGKGSGTEQNGSYKLTKMEGDTKEEDNEYDENKPLNPKHLAKSKRWKDMKKILQAFLKNTNHLLQQVKESKLLTFILRCLSKYIPFLTPFPSISKSLLQTLTSHWCAPFQNEDDHVVRLHAFLRIRQMALTQPYPFIEDCLKALYLAYAKTAKFSTEASLPTLTFMGNCLVELYSLDLDSSYQHAFVYIRQLALHLRTALQKKTKESFQVVYCWQYLQCLKLWTAVLSANPAENELRSLIYPLTEIILGVSRLLPNTRHLPLRLHSVRLLQQLAASSESFIPTTPILLEALDLKELYSKPKKVGGRKGTGQRNLLRLPLVLKLPKEDTLRTSDQLDPCVSELFVLLNREVDLYKYSVAFPEFSVRICQRLRKFNKETKDGRWRAFSKGCIEACERNAAIATNARTVLTEAPKDLKRLEALKPHDQSTMKERHDAAIAKERRLESTSQPRISKKARVKAAQEAKKAMQEQELQKVEAELKSKTKKVKKKMEVNQADLKNVASLGEMDEVKEGIDWSDDEE